MKTFVISLLCGLISYPIFAQLPQTRYEKTDGKESDTYAEVIAIYKQLDKVSPMVQMKTMGQTDANFSLHLVMVSNDRTFDPAIWRKNGKVILFINNGIHPGEPDGIEASMLLIKDIINKKVNLPNNIALAFIPIYNIGGSLNRTPHYRIDQNGPIEKGSRGNSQNLDLNRDFIKCDSKEAKSFAAIFQYLQPDIFIDNHVSNGADYQHVMTLLTSQHSKLTGKMGEYLNRTLEPEIYALMKQKGYDLLPYVNNYSDNPETGWNAYWDGPRYSSGYASLFNTFAFVPETHMLKPFKQRVTATYDLMRSFIDFSATNAQKIKEVRQTQITEQLTQAQFPFGFKVDKEKFQEITYRGYEATKKPSEVSGLPRLFYDRTKPFEKKIKFYNFFNPTSFIEKPKAYILPQGWWKVIELLKANQITMTPLKADTTLEVEVYRIEDYKSSQRPYEGHHLNTEVKTSKSVQKVTFRKGDWYIPMNQRGNRFLMEVLEPTADDSYFAWNYFDTILGQKEGYSSYVFEDIAANFLAKNPSVKEKLEEKRGKDAEFAKNASAQLYFVYQNSPYYEPNHLRYPVFRVVK